jgi:ADP-heptose:LPS heptosyltransferase
MAFEKWEQVARALHEMGVLVLQFGQAQDRKVKYAYSLCGLTAPKEAVLLLKRVNLVISTDNFLAHAAQMAGTPAITLWGPTSPEVYGYPGHTRLSATGGCSFGKCIANAAPHERMAVYRSVCAAQEHCLDRIPTETIIGAARKILL